MVKENFPDNYHQTENHRFGLEMLNVLNRIDTIPETEFEEKICRVNICATNNVGKIVNEYWKGIKENQLQLKCQQER